MADSKIDPVAYLKSLPDDLVSTGRQLRAPKMKAGALAEGTNAGYVDDGSLVSFVSAVSGQARQDVLNSTLLAQLASNKVADRFTNINGWYRKYVEVLENLGWVIESFDFTKYHGSGTTVTMDKVVLELLAAIATDNEEAVVTETLNALKALDKGDGRLVLFDTSSQSLDKGNFQIGVANEQNDAVSFSVGAFHFSTSETHTRFLWWGYSTSDIDMFQAKQKMTLNDQVYGKVRDKVLQKLGKKVEEYIDDLDI